MTNESVDTDSGELDLSALADSLFAADETTEEKSTEEESKEQAGEGADKESAEGSKETLATEEKKFTVAEIRQMVADSQAKNDEQARLAEIQKLLEEGDDESMAKVGKLVKVASEEAQRQEKYGSAAKEQVAEELLPMILPDTFVASLSNEEKATIDPDKFTSETEWLNAVFTLRAAKASAGRTEEEIEAIVNERIAAKENAARTEQMRKGSPSAIPGASGDTEAGFGLQGEAKLDAIWSEAVAEMV